MSKLRLQRVILSTIIILLSSSPLLYQSISKTTYSKIWTLSNGSKLKISFSPNAANLLVDKIYTYKANFEALALGPNLEGFFEIAVQLRFETSEKIIKSDLKANIGDLSTINSQIHVLLKLTVPPADEISLNYGESVQGQLQYIVYYSEYQKDWDKSEMAPNQWPHESDTFIGWEIISQGKITHPYLNFKLAITIALVTTLLSGSGILVYFIARKRKSRN